MSFYTAMKNWTFQTSYLRSLELHRSQRLQPQLLLLHNRNNLFFTPLKRPVQYLSRSFFIWVKTYARPFFIFVLNFFNCIRRASAARSVASSNERAFSTAKS